METFNDDNFEILMDLKDGNKEVAWRTYRLTSLRLAYAYKRIESPKFERIINCGNLLEFRRYSDNSLRLSRANFCQTRLCPMCNFRRSRKIFAYVSRIMETIIDDYEFIFLTLTVRNVKGDKLKWQIDELVSAFKRLCLRKRFSNAVHGWIKSFEVTYNWVSGEYHPHFHCVLAVDKSYFTSDLYISHDEWCKMWQSCLRVDYKPNVDIRVFKESDKGLGKEIAEVAKYAVKSSHIMSDLREIHKFGESIFEMVRKGTDKTTDEIVITLDSALAKRRLVAFGGIFKQKHRELNLLDEDVVDGTGEENLIHISNSGEPVGLDYEVELYRWNSNIRQYVRDKGEHETGGVNDDDDMPF